MFEYMFEFLKFLLQKINLWSPILLFLVIPGCSDSLSSKKDELGKVPFYEGANGNFLLDAFPGNEQRWQNDIRDFADIFRMDGFDLPGFFNDPSLTAVTRDFGKTKISMQSLPIISAAAVGVPKPWSSWWFPKKEDRLFRDVDSTHLSVLTKYDLYRRALYLKSNKPQPKSAAAFEKLAYKANSQSWEGLCDAWSIAAVLFPEPTKSVTVSIGAKNLTFSVGELKALLLKTFEAVNDTDFKFYGQKFTGDFKGWIFPDLFPDQFHRYLEVQLFQKKQSFLMDHDPGIQVWSVPVYKSNYIIRANPDDTNSVIVQAWLFSAEASDANQFDFVGTREAIREYNYILKGTRAPDGDLIVDSGVWIKSSGGVDSRQDHPDYVAAFPDPTKVTRKSWNPEIELEIVDKLLALSH